MTSVTTVPTTLAPLHREAYADPSRLANKRILFRGPSSLADRRLDGYLPHNVKPILQQVTTVHQSQRDNLPNIWTWDNVSADKLSNALEETKKVETGPNQSLALMVIALGYLHLNQFEDACNVMELIQDSPLSTWVEVWHNASPSQSKPLLEWIVGHLPEGETELPRLLAQSVLTWPCLDAQQEALTALINLHSSKELQFGFLCRLIQDASQEAPRKNELFQRGGLAPDRSTLEWIVQQAEALELGEAYAPKVQRAKFGILDAMPYLFPARPFADSDGLPGSYKALKEAAVQ